MDEPAILDALIVGAGFSGLCMAIKLLEAGIDSFVILEKASEVGGTWRENTYPGAGCDVQSHLYSFSFDGNPDWSKRYAGWREILTYIRGVVDRHGLGPYLRFNKTVVGATFDEQNGFWNVAIQEGESLRARTFILGTGPLHIPSIPNIPGLDSFEGTQFHSACWDHTFDFQGKSVASIGTGGSAIQYVPEIAKQVDHLTVYQRTAPWIVPRWNPRYSEMEKALFRTIPLSRMAHRAWLYVANEIRVLPLMMVPLGDQVRPLIEAFIARSVDDPELAKRVTPDYRVGCKRVLISNEYYPALNRENVDLVTESIVEVRGNCILTEDGQSRKVDAIVLGTGFVADPRVFMRKMTFEGMGGLSLHEKWKQGAEAYLGISVSDFPNLFLMTGPNTGLGHNSIIYMIEAQAHYIAQCLLILRRKKAKYMSIKATEFDKFNAEMAQRLDRTVWNSGCKSWYIQEDGKNFTLWPGFTFSYRSRTRTPNTEHYDWIG